MNKEQFRDGLLLLVVKYNYCDRDDLQSLIVRYLDETLPLLDTETKTDVSTNDRIAKIISTMNQRLDMITKTLSNLPDADAVKEMTDEVENMDVRLDKLRESVDELFCEDECNAERIAVLKQMHKAVIEDVRILKAKLAAVPSEALNICELANEMRRSLQTQAEHREHFNTVLQTYGCKIRDLETNIEALKPKKKSMW